MTKIEFGVRSLHGWGTLQLSQMDERASARGREERENICPKLNLLPRQGRLLPDRLEGSIARASLRYWCSWVNLLLGHLRFKQHSF